jgi:hypothetical protein
MTRNMPRMLLDVEVRGPFGPVRIMTTHLEYFSPELRAGQVHAIREIVRASILRARQPHKEGKGPYPRGALPGAWRSASCKRYSTQPTGSCPVGAKDQLMQFGFRDLAGGYGGCAPQASPLVAFVPRR